MLCNPTSPTSRRWRRRKGNTTVPTRRLPRRRHKSKLRAVHCRRRGLNLGFCKSTKSPISGIAGIRAANIGDLVGTDQRTLLATVSQIDPILVQFPISEQEYFKLRDFLLARAAQLQSSLELIAFRWQHLSDQGKNRHSRARGRVDNRHFADSGHFPEPRKCPPARPVFENSRRDLGAERRAAGSSKSRPGVAGRVRTCFSGTWTIRLPSEPLRRATGSGHIARFDRASSLNPADRVVIEGLQDIKTGQTVDPKPAQDASTECKVRFSPKHLFKSRFLMSKFFINRPVTAIVISILIVIAGIIMAQRLPIAQFPSISPPENCRHHELHRSGRAHD